MMVEMVVLLSYGLQKRLIFAHGTALKAHEWDEWSGSQTSGYGRKSP
jgi:hypothetical protein